MISVTGSHGGHDLLVEDEVARNPDQCPHCNQSGCISCAPPVARDAEAQTPAASRPTAEGIADLATLSPPPTPEEPGGNREPISDLPDPVPDTGATELYDFLAPPENPDELGRLGPYRILQVLGTGGMGVVYQAEDVHLHRLVALKALLPTLAASAAARQRFLREAQAVAALVHDHIIPIHNVGEDRGIPYLAMPFLQGEPLDSHLRREGRLPLADILRIGRETAEGLAAAHAHGLVHRDIKPANLWLETSPGERGVSTPWCRVRIVDFGLARSTAEAAHLTQLGAIVGTPAYMAPEQAEGDPVDARSDLFSLGCVLYRMCTGQLPFRGETTIATLLAVATEPPRPLHLLNPMLPKALADLVMQLLAKRPDSRPGSARAVAEALAAIEQALARGALVPRSNPSLNDGRRKLRGMRTVPLPFTGRVTRRETGDRARRRLLALAVKLLVLIGVGLGAYALIRTGLPRDVSVPRSANQTGAKR
jgi:serine/threonine protein kinase